MTYTLVNYIDVWGNKEEGYTVNDQTIECKDLFLADDATEKDICEYLKNNRYLVTSDMRKLSVTDWGSFIEVCEKKTQKPLYALVYNEI